MATLAELWEAEAPAPVKSAKVPSQDQAMREKIRMDILQAELTKAQERLAKGDPRAQGDIAGLTREMGGKVARTAPIAAAPATSGTLADLWESTPAATTKEQTKEQAKEQLKEEPSKVRSLVGNILGKGLEMKQQVPGFLASAADVVASAPSAIASTIGYGAGRLFGLSPDEATAASQKVGGALAEPVGRMTGLSQTEGYRQALPTQVMEYIGKNINEGAQAISKKFGVPVSDVENAINAAMMAGGAAAPKVVKTFKAAAAELQPTVAPSAAPSAAPVTKPSMVSAGAAVVPDATTIKQALSVATPELQQAISAIPVDKVNIPTLMRHIEADSLPKPMRLTEGMATGDIVKLSNEQNRRGKDSELAYRFNELNNDLVENIGLIRDQAAPDVYGTKKIENSQSIIDAYKELDNNLNKGINADYQALRDAAGGQFPVDAPQLLKNIETKLKKELLSNEAPAGQLKELQRLAESNSMTFEDYLSGRRNLGDIARTHPDGSVRKAASYMIEEFEKLPLKAEAAAQKPLADKARASARARFQMLEKDPAMKAAVNDTVPADKFIDKFVVNGVNKNINTMVEHLGRDSPAHQHMAAGTVNWLTDKAGIVDGNGNFSQAGYNKALKKLDDVQNLNAIFNPEAASQLKTLGNVARYTQAQPRGAFVNNSNTLVGSLAEKAGKGVAMGVEKGLNVAVPGLQLGTSVMEMRARRASEAETRKALETGAGIRQSGSNKVSDLSK
jgi:hypothetical protein